MPGLGLNSVKLWFWSIVGFCAVQVLFIEVLRGLKASGNPNSIKFVRQLKSIWEAVNFVFRLQASSGCIQVQDPAVIP